MNMTGNTILITGGGSGIGRGLAEAFHKLGNHVVIAGRDQKRLADVTSANRGMRALTADMASPESVRSFAARVTADFPSLNVAILCAGVMMREDILNQHEPLTDVDAIIATNFTGVVHLTVGLLPLLRRQPQATIMTVSSGLAFVPMAMTPTYCASKAALHSYTQSLRYQLQQTSVEVIELIPPYVQTHLLGPSQAKDPAAMPLADFIAETMDILKNEPNVREINVQRVHALRFAAEAGQAKYDELFKEMNDRVTAAAKR